MVRLLGLAFALPFPGLLAKSLLDGVRQSALVQGMRLEHCPKEGPNAAAGEPVQKLPLPIRPRAELQSPKGIWGVSWWV